MERRLRITRRFAFSLEILVLYVIQGTPGLLPKISGSAPSLLICVALTIAIAENEICAMVFGFVCGLLTDIGYTNHIGYFAVMLTAVCFFTGYFTENIFVTNFLNTMLFSVAVIFILFSLHFLIFHIMLIHTPLSYYVSHYLIRMAYTLVFIPPLYALNKFLRSRT